MRKILSGMLGIIMTASVVGGVAYAAFTSTASVEGVSFSSGDANLLVWDGTAYVSVFNSGWTFSGLFPGQLGPTQSFWLKNTSSGPIDLTINGKLRDGVEGDWEAFKNNVEVAITDFEAIPNNELDWHDLNTWNAGTALFDVDADTTLSQNEQHQYTMHVRVKSSAGSEFENKTLSSVEFDFTGTTP